MPNKTNVLWVDPENMDVWSKAFQLLNTTHAISITPHLTRDAGEILKKARGKQVVIIHWGTNGDIDDLRSLLEKLTTQQPKTRIGLVTCCKHQLVEQFVDFYVCIVDSEELARLIKEGA